MGMGLYGNGSMGMGLYGNGLYGMRVREWGLYGNEGCNGGKTTHCSL